MGKAHAVAVTRKMPAGTDTKRDEYGVAKRFSEENVCFHDVGCFPFLRKTLDRVAKKYARTKKRSGPRVRHRTARRCGMAGEASAAEFVVGSRIADFQRELERNESGRIFLAGGQRGCNGLADESRERG